MTKSKIFLLSIIMLSYMFSCNTQPKDHTMKTNKNKHFSCDIETGVCAPTTSSQIEEINLIAVEKVKLIYYTDPICSACWAIEPQLKKFKLEYGDFVEIDYKMGGLLPNWDGFNDSGNGISKPSDVAHHWDEVGQLGMSIDGDVWIEDPLSSSYPPSIAFKAIQKQGKDLAILFLREIRQMVFLEKKNITKEEYLLQAVENCNGDTVKFLSDYHNEEVKQSFYHEINEGKKMGVRGFPTFVFVGKNGAGFKLSGMSAYDNYVLALEKAHGTNIEAKPIRYSELELLKKYTFLSTKEISFILSKKEEKTISNLEELVRKGLVRKEMQKFGIFWRYI